MIEYEARWPNNFHKLFSKKVVTMASSRKQIKIGPVPVYDTNLIIYSRVLGLQNVWDINPKDILKFELAPVLPSMFEEPVTCASQKQNQY